MSASLDELKTIKWILVGILLVFTVFFIFASVVLKGVLGAIRDMRELRKSEGFRILGEQYLDKGQISELMAEAKDVLKTHPNHAYANYYLAMAYYRKERWVDAQKIFETLRDNKPEWGDAVDPYIAETREKISNGKPKLVR
ncbi:hypothetical protein FKG94_10440 [Exilibacterium tricleocarpae]|uniref:Uncharacterized protein n=1 Tax=Exilibacterium tricleocarpae TaxID=2591008 RepID=A0A545TS92_9GAMM|nr:tetratricopeptide repeat protein [Exilibacterium tricleocarpae]TQV80079.1 hypothetical protein FKG94_10440 [Exilibacterium tricleocarpae]